MKRGDIVLIPMDFTDKTGRKLRPVVVVSENRSNNLASYRNFTALSISSVIRPKHPYGITVDPSKFPGTRLKMTSMIYVDNIQRLEKKFIRKIIGKIPDELINKINDLLIASLGILKSQR